MNDDEPATAREEIVEILSLYRVVDIARFLLVEDEDIGLVELSLGRKRIRTGRPRAALVEERHPFLQEPRIVVRARAMRLRTGADEHPQRVLGGRRETGERGDEDGGEEQERSHGFEYSEPQAHAVRFSLRYP